MKRNSFLLLLITLLTFNAWAADKTWIGSGTQNWSDPNAWVPTGVPGANDRVFFDGTGTCNLDMNATVAHFEFQSTFSGIFNQNAFTLTVNTNFSLSATGMMLDGSGTFNGGTENINLARLTGGLPIPVSSLTLKGSVTFNSTSDTLLIQGNFTRTDPAVFNHNNGWVVMRGTNGAPYNTLTGNTTFNSIEFNPITDFDDFNINQSTDLTVLDTLLKSGNSKNSIFDGDIFLKGDLVITNIIAIPTTPPYGDAKIYIDGTSDQHIVGKASTFTNNFLENIYIDKPSGTLFLHNYITVGPDWHYIRGTIDPGTSTIEFRGTGTISGSHVLYNVRFWNLQWNNARRDIESSTVLTVSNRLEFEGNNWADIYDGAIHAKGDVVVRNLINSGGLYSYNGSTTTIVINGTTDQTLEGQTSRKEGFLPNIVIDKPSGTLFLKDTINVERSWTYIQGNVDAITHNSYVNFVPNYNFYNASDLPQNIDGEGTSATMLFNHVGIDNPNNIPLSPINRMTRNLTGDLRVSGILNIRNHRLTMNGNDIFIENAAITGIQNTTGYIISETTPATSVSSIHWFIDNAPIGSAYTFPFATTAGEYIPVSLSVGVTGIPAGIGSISMGTYPTDPSSVPNNRPLPPGVTQLNSFIGPENYPRELDRFWIYGCNNYSTTPTVNISFTYRDSEWNTGGNTINESLLRPHQWNPANSHWEPPIPGSTINTAVNIASAPDITTCSAFTLVDPTAPSLTITASDTLLCNGGGTVTFGEVLTSPGPTSRLWYFPGGTPSTSTASSPVVTYNVPGTYHVILFATYPGGTLGDTLFDYIKVADSIFVTAQATDALCNGAADGAVTLLTTGGTLPYSHLWSNGAATTTLTGIPAGQYSVTVTDAYGCTAADTATVVEPPALVINLVALQPATCNQCDGSITIGTTGGSGFYTFWLDGTTSISTTASNLCAGQHSIVAIDANSCTDTLDFVISGIGTPSVNTGVTNDSLSICAGDFVQLNAFGGMAYTWLPINFLSNPNIPNPVASPVASITYNVAIHDSSFCVDTFSVYVDVNQSCCDTITRNTGVAFDSITICPGDTAQLTAFGGISYNWFPPGDLSNSNISNPLVYPGASNIYNVSVRFTLACTDTYSVLVSVDSCVWPGDANYDGIANNQDVLAIGIGFGVSGLARPNASLVWEAQAAPSWQQSLPGGVNYKHVDCNGDGVIDNNDTLAVSLNYGLTHSKMGAPGRSTDPALYFDIPADTASAGQIVDVPVFLGSDTLQVANFYGIAFSIEYSNQIVEDNVMLAFLPDTSFAGIPFVSTLTFSKAITGNSKLDVAQTRITHTNASGWGRIGTFRFKVRDDLTPKDLITHPLYLSFSNVKMIDAQANDLPVFATDTVLYVKQIIDGIEEDVLEHLSVYPNPTNGQLMIRATELSGSTTIRLYDALGSKLYDIVAEGSEVNNGIALNLHRFSGNMFFLRIINGTNQRSVKVMKY